MRTSLEFTRKFFNDVRSPVVVAEIGVEAGCHAKEFLENWPEITECHLIDIWPNEDIMNMAIANVDKFRSKINFHRNTSEQMVHIFTDEYFDFIYIDGDHSFEAVKFDVAHWWDKLKIGGVLAGHDFGKHGVTAAVQDVLVGRGWINRDYPKDSMDWWVIKERGSHDIRPNRDEEGRASFINGGDAYVQR